MLIKGYSHKSDANDIVETAWHLMAALSLDVHFEYVPSKRNIADGPSRGSWW